MKLLTFKLRLPIALLFLLLLAVRVPATLGQQPLASPSPASQALVHPDLAKRQEAFQIVWGTVNDLFYDPEFGGVNWAKVRERYEPLVSRVSSDREFHMLLQQMLNELHQSHFMVVPKEAIPKIRVAKDPEDSTASDADAVDAEEVLNNINYKLTDRLLTGIGIDLRVLGGSAVVTRVEPGSTAARAGLRPGFVIKKVGQRSLDSVIAEIENHPLWGALIRPELPVFLIAGFINGEQTSPVKLGFLDARNRLHTITIKRERLKGEMSPAIGNLPSMYTEFESKRLPGGIGYIRFNAFVPSLMEKLCGALRSMKDARGIILDLRGNQGGLLGMIGGLTGLLETSPTSIGTMHTRTGRVPLFVFPQTSPYSGPLVILVDGSTQSAGEIFASGLQESGRAILIGEKSAGNTLPSAIRKLPTGAIFQYGFANYETSAGKRLEGSGITPDLTVTLSRKSLLRRGDPQLSTAIRRLRQKIRQGVGPELIADVEVTSPAPAARTASPPPSVSIVTAPSVPPGVVVDPPPPPLRSAPMAVTGDPTIVVPGMPSVGSILDRYLEASGGKKAFEKIISRKSIGTVEITALGMTGTAELYEQAPDRSSLIIVAPGLGTIQRTFDGDRAWLQDPLQGFIRFTGLGYEIAKASSVFDKQTKLKEMYPSALLIGKEKLNGRDTYVVRMGFEKWYFDVESGLLLRKGNTYYEDYREVDGIKLPFKMRDEIFSGVGLIYQLTEIQHNVKIDEAKFTANPSCFTKQ
ncbi:MAG TPA: S41 family peptidase [Pyrinomonadaceae bacterium]|jgi:carboxyl-terminal processing protease